MTTTLRGGDNFDSGTPVTAALQKELKSGRKNLIINGGMKVAQRGTSFTDPASGAYALDRWKAGLQTATGAGNYTQEDDAPTAAEAGTDFIKCLKFTCTTIDTSTTTSNRYWTSYSAEGQDIAHIGFGKAGTRYVTLSFWHKHTKTGTHSLGLQSGAGDRHYASEYTQTTTETWEKATTTIPVDTSGTWATDTSVGMRLFFATHIGADYQGTPDTWEAGQGYGTANQVNNLDSTSNSMRFTGVQLELGSVATDFEHRSYGEEFALCQRYFQSYGATWFDLKLGQFADTGGVWSGAWSYPNGTMRGVPTIIYHDNVGTVGKMSVLNLLNNTTTNGVGARPFYGRDSSVKFNTYAQATGMTVTGQSGIGKVTDFTLESEL